MSINIFMLPVRDMCGLSSIIGQNVSLGTSLSELYWFGKSVHFTLLFKGFPFALVMGVNHGEITHASLMVMVSVCIVPFDDVGVEGKVS